MNRTRTAGLALAGAALLAGCATSKAATDSSPHQAPPAANADRPSASAAMICGTEIRDDITHVLALNTAPRSTSRFVDHLFTCTYRLPAGQFVLSVKDLTDAPATSRYYEMVRHTLGNPASVAGLGEGAFGTQDGKIVLRKDSHVLQVDASGLPPVFGAYQEKRGEFAYQIASDILGCWTEG